MDAAFLVTSFVTLFVIIDPIGLAPLFVALTRGMTAAQRRAIGLRACLVAVGLLTLFGVAGESLLHFVGISMSAFRISGGLLLFFTAFDMLFERRTQRREGQVSHEEELPEHDPSVFPLATPLIAGPGAMATMILLAGRAHDGWQGVIAVHLVMIAVVACAFALFFAAGLLERLLGRTGTNVVTRLLGMLLAALSVQFVIDGIVTSGLIHAAG